jgi:hypothetical protein
VTHCHPHQEGPSSPGTPSSHLMLPRDSVTREIWNAMAPACPCVTGSLVSVPATAPYLTALCSTSPPFSPSLCPYLLLPHHTHTHGQVLACLVFTSMCVTALLLGRRPEETQGRLIAGAVSALCMVPCRVLLPYLYKSANEPPAPPGVQVKTRPEATHKGLTQSAGLLPRPSLASTPVAAMQLCAQAPPPVGPQDASGRVSEEPQGLSPGCASAPTHVPSGARQPVALASPRRNHAPTVGPTTVTSPAAGSMLHVDPASGGPSGLTRAERVMKFMREASFLGASVGGGLGSSFREKLAPVASFSLGKVVPVRMVSFDSDDNDDGDADAANSAPRPRTPVVQPRTCANLAVCSWGVWVGAWVGGSACLN